MKKDICISWLVVICLIFLAVPVMAQEGRIHVGSLKITPGLSLQGVHDDNIYLDNGKDESEKSDWGTHVMPSLFFDLDFRERLVLQLGYEGDIALFCEEDAPEGYILKYQHYIDGPGAMQAAVHTHIAYFVPKPLPTLREVIQGMLTCCMAVHYSDKTWKAIREAYYREEE